MRIPIDHQSDVSLYQQIETYLRQSILSGSLIPDTRLPASRELAEVLGISRTTVESAYAALEAEGLVVRRVGSGTYVLSPDELPAGISSSRREQSTPPDWPLWQQEFLSDAKPVCPVGSRHPAPIAFTGVGDPRRFPARDFSRAIKAALQRDGTAALELGDIRGYAPLRSTTTHILASQGLPISPDSVLITAGSQQALALITQLLLRRGDVVLVESPTYDLALELFRLYKLNIVGCPVDAQGMKVEQLEPVIQQYHPRLIYTIPNFQNPTGTCLSLFRRQQLIALAERYNIPVIEDDFVGDLRYEGHAQPPLKALDPGGRVIYIGTFSKMLIPGLRIGFLIADGPVYDRLVELKWVYDLATSNLIQRALEIYITVGRYQAHLRRSCQIYRRRRDTMLRAIDRYLPAETRVIPPHGGLFIWLNLPVHLSGTRLMPIAIQEGVEYTPGNRFFPNSTEGEHNLRLNFVVQSPENIEEGMRRLGKAIAMALR